MEISKAEEVKNKKHAFSIRNILKEKVVNFTKC